MSRIQNLIQIYGGDLVSGHLPNELDYALLLYDAAPPKERTRIERDPVYEAAIFAMKSLVLRHWRIDRNKSHLLNPLSQREQRRKRESYRKISK